MFLDVKIVTIVKMSMLPVLVTSPVTVIKYPDKNNLGEKAFFWHKFLSSVYHSWRSHVCRYSI